MLCFYHFEKCVFGYKYYKFIQQLSFRYDANLDNAKTFGIRKGLANGLGIGFIYLVFFGAYALAFWYGSKLVRQDEYTAGTMLIVSNFDPLLV